ncbi:hypothetical protein P5E85_11475 [Clostridium perfringens]|uniref:hypothetical protein n=1 Tax=Clostridium perfringens TaxID=1502 RepID=UPI0024BC8F03|nr:hypothetical protein [Clostridium perfringens]EJT6154261.1 hypothetical protein [Clostridium perfringens]MDK0760448.1 hypothetical protein [Clostridium perfringens]MDM0545823.1 hypothetical protein [Clostridium perfringens]
MSNKKIMIITGIITIITLIVAIIGEIIPTGYFKNIYFLRWLTGHRNFGISLLIGLSTGCLVGCITAFINWKTDLLEKRNNIMKLLKNIYADSRALSSLFDDIKNEKQEINEIEIRNRLNYLIIQCDKFIYMDKSIVEDEKCESIDTVINSIKTRCLNIKIDIRDNLHYMDTIMAFMEESKRLQDYSDKIKINMLDMNIKGIQTKEELERELIKLDNISKLTLM